MNRGWKPRELITAIYEDLGKHLADVCHELYGKSVNWCLEHGVPSSALEIVISEPLPKEDIPLSFLVEAPLLFSRGEWTPNFRELLIRYKHPTITPRISFDSFDEAQEHGFSGQGILLTTGDILHLTEEGLIQIVGQINKL